LLDPAAVVIDGSLGAAGQYVLAGIRESIDRRTVPSSPTRFWSSRAN
jgi:hypothetical protein